MEEGCRSCETGRSAARQWTVEQAQSSTAYAKMRWRSKSMAHLLVVGRYNPGRRFCQRRGVNRTVVCTFQADLDRYGETVASHHIVRGAIHMPYARGGRVPGSESECHYFLRTLSPPLEKAGLQNGCISIMREDRTQTGDIGREAAGNTQRRAMPVIDVDASSRPRKE